MIHESQDVGQTHKLRHLSTEYIATKFSHCHPLVSGLKKMSTFDHITSYHIPRLPYFHKRIWAGPSSTTSATFQPQHRLLGCHIRSSRRHAAHAAAAAEGTEQGSGPGDQSIENAIWTALLRSVQWRREGLEIVHRIFGVFFSKSLVFF